MRLFVLLLLFLSACMTPPRLSIPRYLCIDSQVFQVVKDPLSKYLIYKGEFGENGLPARCFRRGRRDPRLQTQ